MQTYESAPKIDGAVSECNLSLNSSSPLAMSGNASALQLVLSADPALMAIVWLSLAVSLAAVVAATLIGLPIGALVALLRFPGRDATIVVLNALMGLPPVVVGL